MVLDITINPYGYVNETNLRGLFTEATSAEEEIVLSNETTAVTTSTAT